MKRLLTASSLMVAPTPDETHAFAAVAGSAAPSAAASPPWTEVVHREYLDKLPAHDRRVLDAFVKWVGPAAEWCTFLTVTWPDDYAETHKGLFGARGAIRWTEQWLDDLGYEGSLILSPEGHRWRDVYHVHGLAEYVDWRRALVSYATETGSLNGLELCRATEGAVEYVCKYVVKADSVHQLVRIPT